MEVEVRLFATFRENRFRTKSIDFPNSSTVQDVVERLEIDLQEVGILLVNGRHTAEEHLLRPGDVVSLFPLVAGG